jgi:predicted amidohydrolase
LLKWYTFQLKYGTLFNRYIQTGALSQVEQLTTKAAVEGAEIICFPESYLPSYPSGEYEVPKTDFQQLQ